MNYFKIIIRRKLKIRRIKRIIYIRIIIIIIYRKKALIIGYFKFVQFIYLEQ